MLLTFGVRVSSYVDPSKSNVISTSDYLIFSYKTIIRVRVRE